MPLRVGQNGVGIFRLADSAWLSPLRCRGAVHLLRRSSRWIGLTRAAFASPLGCAQLRAAYNRVYRIAKADCLIRYLADS